MEHTRYIVEPTHAVVASPALHIVSPDVRIAAGKALRDKVPREQQGRWNGAKGRADPIELLHKSDVGRLKKLIPIRYGRMLQSPFAFYRGSAGVMTADLARTLFTGLKVQACGDCHLLNFGGFATPERSIIFDINDFDETSPGYLVGSNDAFDVAMGKFALAYADQAERDHAALKAAARKGKITASQEC